VLLTRFCAATGVNPEGLSTDCARLNESVGYEQTELLRRINATLGDRLPHPRTGYNGVVKFWFAEEVLAPQVPRQRLGLPREHWDWCVGAAKEMVVRIEQAGYAVHGDLADLIPASEPPEGPHRPSEADVAAAGVAALASMLEDRHQREAVPRRHPAAGTPTLPRLRSEHRSTRGVPGRFRASVGGLVRKIRA
jgi:hypothetical protein